MHVRNVGVLVAGLFASMTADRGDGSGTSLPVASAGPNGVLQRPGRVVARRGMRSKRDGDGSGDGTGTGAGAGTECARIEQLRNQRAGSDEKYR